jgi:hypothetical protein
LRHAVPWRKTSCVTDGEAGSRFVKNILTVVATCRPQVHSVFEYLIRCCEIAGGNGQALWCRTGSCCRVADRRRIACLWSRPVKDFSGLGALIDYTGHYGATGQAGWCDLASWAENASVV